MSVWVAGKLLRTNCIASVGERKNDESLLLFMFSITDERSRRFSTDDQPFGVTFLPQSEV